MPLRGAAGAARNSGLLGLALAFGLVAVGLLAVLVVGDAIAASYLVQRWFEGYGFWAVLVWLALFIAGLPVVFVLYRALSKPLTWEFRRRLAVKAETLYAPQQPWHELPGSWWDEVVTGLKGLPGGLLVSVGALLLNIVPVVGQLLALSVAIWLSARGTAGELLEQPMGRRGFSPDEVTRELRRHPRLWMAAAASTGALSLVPFLNLVALPGAIIGTSDLYAQLEAEGFVPTARADAESP